MNNYIKETLDLEENMAYIWSQNSPAGLLAHFPSNSLFIYSQTPMNKLV